MCSSPLACGSALSKSQRDRCKEDLELVEVLAPVLFGLVIVSRGHVQAGVTRLFLDMAGADAGIHGVGNPRVAHGVRAHAAQAQGRVSVGGLYEFSGLLVDHLADEIDRLRCDASPMAGDSHDGRGRFVGQRVRAHSERGSVEPKLVHQRGRGDDPLFSAFACRQEFPSVRPWYEAIHRQIGGLVAAQKRTVQQLHDPAGAMVVLAVSVGLPGQGLDGVEHSSPFLIGQGLVRQIVAALFGLHLGRVLAGVDLAKGLLVPCQPVPEVGEHLLQNGHRMLEAVIAQWLAKRLFLIAVGLQEGGGKHRALSRELCVRVDMLWGHLGEQWPSVAGNLPLQP